MTLFAAVMLLAFGFLAFRNFRNGRPLWGVVASVGCLVMAGSLWVDYQRAAQPAPTDAH